MSNPVIAFAEKHPVPTGIGVVVVGLIMIYVLTPKGGGGGTNTASDAAAASAYYAASSAQAQAGDAVQMAQIQANAATTIALGSDAASVTNNNTWSATNQAENADNNATAITLAPFAVQSQAVAALNTAAQAPNITTVTHSTDNGFFGIGGGSSNTTTVSPNPVAVNAIDELNTLINGFHPGH